MLAVNNLYAFFCNFFVIFKHFLFRRRGILVVLFSLGSASRVVARLVGFHLCILYGAGANSLWLRAISGEGAELFGYARWTEASRRQLTLIEIW